MSIESLNIAANKLLQDHVNWINAILGAFILQLNMITTMHEISSLCKDFTQIAGALTASVLLVYNAVKLFKEFRKKR